MAANMLSAYYSRGCDSEDLFAGLEIEQDASYREHLNQHNVIRIDVQQFLFQESHLDVFIGEIQNAVMQELAEASDHWSAEYLENPYGLPGALEQIYAHTGKGFIFIIDEWDCVFRLAKNHKDIQKESLSLPHISVLRKQRFKNSAKNGDAVAQVMAAFPIASKFLISPNSMPLYIISKRSGCININLIIPVIPLIHITAPLIKHIVF